MTAIPAPPEPLTGKLRAHDGLGLRYAIYRCENARATVLIIAGRSEFIEKYAETISDLHSAGYGVAILDLRGQGGSDRRPEDGNNGHVDRFSDYTRDVIDFFEHKVRSVMPGPYFLLGHYLGGMIALSVAEKLETRVSGMVLCAPFVGIRHRRYPTWLIRAIAWLACQTGKARQRTSKPRIEPRTFENQNHTSDPVRYARNLAAAETDPPYLLGSVSFGWLSACLSEISRITKPKALAAITCPVFVLSAGRDSIIPETAKALKMRCCLPPRQEL